MDFLGTTTPSVASNLTTKILDIVFNNCALLLKEPDKLANNGLSGKVFAFASDLLGGASLPLLGFTYQNPRKIEYLSYSYSEYPFLNQKLISNSFIKNPTTITLTALRPITLSNTWLLNYFNTKSLVEIVEAYADTGGLFKAITRWGSIDNLALQNLVFSNDGDPNDPGLFTMTFKKLLFIEDEETSAANAVFDVLEKGAGVVASTVAIAQTVKDII